MGDARAWTGGCYCGAIRYEITAKPLFNALCYCRACQHITGGAPNLFLLIPEQGFAITAGRPRDFTRPDLARAVTRSFCEICGTHLTTRRPGLDGIIVKRGTLDDPAGFGPPRAAIFVAEKQPFHDLPEGIAHFDALPPQRS